MSSNYPSSRVSQLIDHASNGDRDARGELFEVFHKEFEGLARAALRREHQARSWQTHDLLNEVALKLLDGGTLDKKLADRSYFLAAVSRAIRQLLIDRARHRKAQKRPQNRVPLDDTLDAIQTQQRIDILSLHDALEQLRLHDARKHDVVQLRFFGGFSHPEIAEILDVSVATVERDWHFSQAWLRANMS